MIKGTHTQNRMKSNQSIIQHTEIKIRITTTTTKQKEKQCNTDNDTRAFAQIVIRH